MTRSRAWVLAVLVGFLPAGVVAALMLYVAWQHNPQGEFHEAGIVHWGSWLSIGAVWFVPCGAPVALLARLVLAAFTESRSPMSDRESAG